MNSGADVDVAVQVSLGQAQGSRPSSTNKAAGMGTASQVSESDLSGLESSTDTSGRRLLKEEDPKSKKQKGSAGKVEADPTRVSGGHTSVHPLYC